MTAASCRLLLLDVTLLEGGEGDRWSVLTMSITTASSLLPAAPARASPPEREARGGDSVLGHRDTPRRDPPVEAAFLPRPVAALSDLEVEGGWSDGAAAEVQLTATSSDAERSIRRWTHLSSLAIDRQGASGCPTEYEAAGHGAGSVPGTLFIYPHHVPLLPDARPLESGPPGCFSGQMCEHICVGGRCDTATLGGSPGYQAW